MLRVSKKKYTYIFSRGQDQDELRLGNLVLRDFTNAFHERSYKHRSLSPKKEKLHSRVARVNTKCCYNDAPTRQPEPQELAFAYEPGYTKVLTADSGVVARLRDPTEFLNEVLLRRPAAFKVLIRWLAAANGMLKTPERYHNFKPRAPKIWMLTGLTLLTNATSEVKQNKYYHGPLPIENRSIILDRTCENVLCMEGTLIWAVEWQLLEVNDVLSLPGRGMELVRIRPALRPAPTCKECGAIRAGYVTEPSLVEYSGEEEEDEEEQLRGIQQDPDEFDIALDMEIRRYERAARRRVMEERRARSDSEETGTLVDSEEGFEQHRPTPPVVPKTRYSKYAQDRIQQQHRHYQQYHGQPVQYPQQQQEHYSKRKPSRPPSPTPMTEDFMEPPSPNTSASNHFYKSPASSMHPNIAAPDVDIYEPEFSEPSDSELERQRIGLVHSKLDRLQELVNDSPSSYPQPYPADAFEVFVEGESGYERTEGQEELDDWNTTANTYGSWGDNHEYRQRQFYEAENYVAEAARESYTYERARYGYPEAADTGYTPAYPTYPTTAPYVEPTYPTTTPTYTMPTPPITVQPVPIIQESPTPASPRRKPWDIPAPLGGKRYHSSGGYGQVPMARSFPPRNHGGYQTFVEPIDSDEIPVYGGNRYGYGKGHVDDAYVGYRSDYKKWGGYEGGGYGGYGGYTGAGRRWGRGRVVCDNEPWGY